ncbi:hypothetical protein JOB18_024755 [Solea senegalensis]|uniref:Uncharacterized protein n=1 Tax=Solea senegalensis TaxID=28829 RepID=A0AAV6S4A5_SOLSE|nr:hypothetical protein JOB18_024755 [Solea senegalensis]
MLELKETKSCKTPQLLARQSVKYLQLFNFQRIEKQICCDKDRRLHGNLDPSAHRKLPRSLRWHLILVCHQLAPTTAITLHQCSGESAMFCNVCELMSSLQLHFSNVFCNLRRVWNKSAYTQDNKAEDDSRFGNSHVTLIECFRSISLKKDNVHPQKTLHVVLFLVDVATTT